MSKKEIIAQLMEYVILYRDPKTGIAWVEDGRTGNGHSCHPNIDRTGSVSGMKKLGYWGKNDIVVLSHGYYYNTSRYIVSDDLDEIAAVYCTCQGCIARRQKEPLGPLV